MILKITELIQVAIWKLKKFCSNIKSIFWQFRQTIAGLIFNSLNNDYLNFVLKISN